MTLYGSHLWSRGKKIICCEGEIDTITVAAQQGLRWPTVRLAKWRTLHSQSGQTKLGLPHEF